MSAVLNLDTSGNLDYNHEPFEIEHEHILKLKDAILAQNNCGKLIGYGSYGQVYEINGRDQVIKICTPKSLETDAYHAYLKVLLSETNPFFPKVDRFIKVKSRDGFNDVCIVYGVRMERLKPFDQCSQSVLETMGEELFYNYAKQNQLHGSYGPCWTIIAGIKDAMNHDDYKSVKNEDLISALKAIRAIQKERSFINDMGTPNFMIRSTPNWHKLTDTVQLVITDPIA